MQNYGQQVPVPHHNGRRHEHIPYTQPSPHQMRSHPGYYYAPPMPQYPQYPQQWYPASPYQPHYTLYQQRPPHFSYHQHMPPPLMPHQPHGPLIISSHPPPPPLPPSAHLPRPYPPPYTNQQHQDPLTPIPPATSSKAVTPPSRSISAVSSSQNAQDSLSSPMTESLTAQAQITTKTSDHGHEPFWPPLPWLSDPDSPFPPRAARQSRKIRRSQLNELPRCFPAEPQPSVLARSDIDTSEPQDGDAPSREGHNHASPIPSDSTAVVSPALSSSQISTLPSTTAPQPDATQKTSSQQRQSRAGGPVVPVVPAIMTSPASRRKSRQESTVSSNSKRDSEEEDGVRSSSTTAEAVGDTMVSVPVAPKSWADLVRKQAAANGVSSGAGVSVFNGFGAATNENLGDVLGGINVAEEPSKVSFLRPRGLVNTGNMCYMNSVLQVLVFCTPFYAFLDKVAQRAAYTFKSSTPLIDAMILFMKEYPPIDSASSTEKLRLSLKTEDVEKYGDSLRPDFVYDTINKLPRFRDMRRGAQQDAQEFLGFLLEELHEECTLAMSKAGTSNSSGRSSPVASSANMSETADNSEEWLEVGKKQKPSVTRSSGSTGADSPINNIFGGKLRSEFKVPGDKTSVTFEQYQPLQLDIGSPEVNNIIDALKGLTKPESMQGVFPSARGTRASATKQVFIETLPPVLILHLKRFHYDSTTRRAEKIWKKIGYPLELEMPKEVFNPTTRTKLVAHGSLPRYRLISVIYHHGKNANGGHYTVDIRRQDGREWIRLDDTIIRRIRSEDVAGGGSEEDPKVLAAALEKHKKQIAQGANRFHNIEASEEEQDESLNAWSQVNGHSKSKLTSTTVAAVAINGTATPVRDVSGPQTPRYKESLGDNKVAYLLFYQRINS